MYDPAELPSRAAETVRIRRIAFGCDVDRVAFGGGAIDIDSLTCHDLSGNKRKVRREARTLIERIDAIREDSGASELRQMRKAQEARTVGSVWTPPPAEWASKCSCFMCVLDKMASEPLQPGLEATIKLMHNIKHLGCFSFGISVEKVI